MAKEQEVKDTKIDNVTFNAEQLSVIQRMIAETKENKSSVNSVSVYNIRDPKSIETVNVKRIDGKFVTSWKNWNKDSFKKKPVWLQYKSLPRMDGTLLKEPYITIYLSEDGVTFEEKEMPLIDYMTDRDSIKCKVLKIDMKEVVEDFGILGSSGEYATAVDAKGLPEVRPTILAQVKHEERVFTVEVPGFEKPFEFISEFLG